MLTRDPSRADLIYLVEASNDLATWTGSPRVSGAATGAVHRAAVVWADGGGRRERPFSACRPPARPRRPSSGFAMASPSPVRPPRRSRSRPLLPPTRQATPSSPAMPPAWPPAPTCCSPSPRATRSGRPRIFHRKKSPPGWPRRSSISTRTASRTCSTTRSRATRCGRRAARRLAHRPGRSLAPRLHARCEPRGPHLSRRSLERPHDVDGPRPERVRRGHDERRRGGGGERKRWRLEKCDRGRRSDSRGFARAFPAAADHAPVRRRFSDSRRVEIQPLEFPLTPARPAGHARSRPAGVRAARSAPRSPAASAG